MPEEGIIPGTMRLNLSDNVAVVLPGPHARPISDPRTRQVVPPGHKVAVADIAKGDAVIKYGQFIGVATRDIIPGEHVHTHNMGMGAMHSDSPAPACFTGTPVLPLTGRATFEGFVRGDGRVGTRNYIGILPTVSCAASVCRLIANSIGPDLLERHPSVDGIVALGHGSGCGMAGHGEGFENLRRSIAGYAEHPNFWGVLLVGLGCEVNQVRSQMECTQLLEGERLRAVVIQDAGGTAKTVAIAVEALREMLSGADRARRQTVPASELVLGLECGGSDAYSGITANPALGAAADLLVAHGGTAILSETTEVYGAEHLLTDRAVSAQVAERLIERIRWWEDYTRRNGAEIDNNPTPGNKAGGITTILEKSLGAVAKGGTTDMKAVYRYAERVREKGLVFMDTPGYDLPSITGLVAGGAQVVCFTTGCGSVMTCRPSPIIKLASNSAMYKKLEGDMDIDCGPILEGSLGVQKMGEIIFRKILEVASGEKTKGERHGFGDIEFVPWQIGAVV